MPTTPGKPTKLDKQLALFHDRPEVGVVFSRRSLIDEMGNQLSQAASPPPSRGRILDRMFVQNHVCFSSAIVRRMVLTHVGAFDPEWDLAIDFDLWLRVAKHYEFDFVNEELGEVPHRAWELVEKGRRPRRYGSLHHAPR